jgi:hypothetical protein
VRGVKEEREKERERGERESLKVIEFEIKGKEGK